MIDNVDKQWLLKINNFTGLASFVSTYILKTFSIFKTRDCLLILPNCADLCFIPLAIQLLSGAHNSIKHLMFYLFGMASPLATKRSSKNLNTLLLSKFFDSDKIKEFQL